MLTFTRAHAATAFEQLWTAHFWHLKEQGNECDGHAKCCGNCREERESTEPPAATTADAMVPPEATTEDTTEPRRAPTTGTSSTEGVTVVPPTSAGSFDWLWLQVRGRLSVVLRVLAFLCTLVAVAAVPVLIVVYRGRVIGWLMSVVFHEDAAADGGRQSRSIIATATAATDDVEDAADEHRGRHTFFLLNYTNTGELSSWKTVMAAMCAAFVQLTAIVAVHRGYSAVAEWLTKYSYRSVYDPRFQGRYTAYMSCFDSANYYSSLVYIAFFKVSTQSKNPHAAPVGPYLQFWCFWAQHLFRPININSVCVYIFNQMINI